MMSVNKEYSQALQKATNNITDIKERGDSAIGDDVLDFMNSDMTAEEIAESNLRVALIEERKTREGYKPKKT